MSKQKVWVKKMPESCNECPCFDDCRMQCNINYNDLEYIFRMGINKRDKDCPLIDIKYHDREKDKRIKELEKDLEFTTKIANELIEIKHKLEQELAELKKNKKHKKN